MVDGSQSVDFDQLLNSSTPHAASNREEVTRRLAAAERFTAFTPTEDLEAEQEHVDPVNSMDESMGVPSFLDGERQDDRDMSAAPRSTDGFVQSIRRRIDAQVLRYEGVLQRARGERFTGHSVDGSVTAVLGGEGDLLELTVERVSSGDLSASVLQALNQAETLARRRMDEVMTEAGLSLREEPDDDADRLLRQFTAPVDYHSIDAVDDPLLKNRLAEALEGLRTTVLDRLENRHRLVRTEVGEGLGHITTDAGGSVKEVCVEQAVWRRFGTARVAEEILAAVQAGRSR